MLAKKVQDLRAAALREAIDQEAEREGRSLDLHRVEHRSVFCPINLTYQRGRTVAEELGYSLSGVVGYLRRW